jgi:hypothetical protein
MTTSLEKHKIQHIQLNITSTPIQTIGGAPLTLSNNQISFNYDSDDFQLNGNSLQINNIHGDARYYTQTQLDEGQLNSLYYTETESDALYAPIAKGVTNGDGHNHSGGDGAQIDHGELSGRSDDDHTIYPLLLGRSGGQTLIGGTDSGDDLTLQSTSHITKGSIIFGTSAYDEVNNRLGIGTTPSYPLHLTTSSGTDAEIRAQTANGSDNARLTLLATGNQEWHIESDRSNNLMQIGSSVYECIKIYGSDGVVKLPTGYLTIGDSSISTETLYIEMGSGRTDNGYAYIDLVGDTTYTDYGLRIIRNNTGANTSSTIAHRGTGSLDLNAIDAGSIGFYTSNTLAATIDSSQNVGIGVSPSYRLDVKDDVSGFMTRFFNDGNDSNRNGIEVQCGEDDQSSGQHYYFKASDGNGNATGYLRVNAGTFELIQSSSEKRKTDIQDSNIDALNIINNLPVRSFRRRAKAKTLEKDSNYKPPINKAGFIAEECLEIYPEMVASDPDGDLFISQSKLIPVLCKAIQQLVNKIGQLEDRLDVSY